MTTPSVTLYGIANCDTVRKARAWLQEMVAPLLRDFGAPLDIEPFSLGRDDMQEAPHAAE